MVGIAMGLKCPVCAAITLAYDANVAGHLYTNKQQRNPDHYAAISLVHILNCCRTIAPKEVVKAVSAASRPWAMTMRPMRG